MARTVRPLRAIAVGVLLVCLLSWWAAPGLAAAGSVAGPVVVATSPAVAGLSFALGGQVSRTGPNGQVVLSASDLTGVQRDLRLVGTQASPSTRVTLLSVVVDPSHPQRQRHLVAKLALAHPVSVRLTDRTGAVVPAAAVTSVSLRSTDGQARTLRLPADGSPVWIDQLIADRRKGAALQGTRTLTWTVTGARVKGVSVAVGAAARLEGTADGWQIPLSGYPFAVAVRLVPPTAGVSLQLAGSTAVTDDSGAATLYTPDLSQAQSVVIPTPATTKGQRVTLVRVAKDEKHPRGVRSVALAVNVQAPVTFHFMDLAGQSFPTSQVTSVTLGAPLGQALKLTTHQLQGTVWLPVNRLTQIDPPRSRSLTYTVDDSQSLGTNGVFAGTQRFDPAASPVWTVQMHLYVLRVKARDLLFGTQIRGDVQLRAPDRSVHNAPLSAGSASLGQFPRGEYEVTVNSGPHPLTLPVRVAQDQVVEARVITWLDVVVITLVTAGLALLVLVVGGRARRYRQARAEGAPSLVPLAVSPVGGFVLVLALTGALVATTATQARADVTCNKPAVSTTVPDTKPAKASPIPVWGYFYIWYADSSWKRAKIDTPLLGCYTSDDPAVMRAQIRQAKAVGITGFLVSWKHTGTLDSRLQTLATIAAQEKFSLGIVYQALDFQRHPLPPATVRADLTWFAQTYGQNPVFAGGGKPTVVWTGTEQFDAAAVEGVAAATRPTLSLLSSAKSVPDYERVAASVDGNAYYWSSGDPASSGFAKKLAALGQAVHAKGGRWIAPAAPGYDGVAVGGTRQVARADGKTLEVALKAALASEPDALGIISWNEWSENTYVEPSSRYGTKDLAVLASALHASVPTLVAPDSSDDSGASSGGWRGLYAAGVLGGFVVLVVAAVEVRRQAPRRALRRNLNAELPALADTFAGPGSRHS